MNENNSILTPSVINLIIEILKITIWPILIFVIIMIFNKPLMRLLNRFHNVKIVAPLINLEIESSNHTDEEKIENKKSTNKNESKSEDEKTSLIKTEADLKENWYLRLFKIKDKKDIKEAEIIFKEYEMEEKNPRQLFKSRSLYLYYLYAEHHHEKALTDLKELIDNSNNIEDKSNGLIWYTFALEITKQYKKISNLLGDFLKNDVPEELSSGIVFKLIDTYISDDNLIKAKELTLSYLSKFKENKSISELYVKLAKIESELGNNDISSLLLDKAIEYTPDNEDLLFKSAYQASQNGQDFISIVNYPILISLSSKNALALNNLAVCYERNNLKIEAINLYKESSDLDFSLSMANIGFSLLHAGFVKEAESYANNALKTKDIHPNIYKLLNSINEKKEKEKENADKIIKKSESMQKLMRKYIECYITPDDMRIEESKWILPDGIPVSFEKEKDSYIAKWETDIENSTSKYLNSITLNINNLSSKGSYLKFIFPKQQQAILGSSENKYHDIYGYYNNDELIIFSKKDEAEFKMIIKKKVATKHVNLTAM
ncbi:hypothetical protein H4Q82_20860 [Pectobacterium carotovorum subsp. carotovorum]|uniref:tetratricopeptide repeat protein n=1 Tax=Pectobacterium carotovorum TaxID=554 RepID=UPI0015FFA846|nr:hypothetical protein [Pectobacterium carotovorum]MBB1528936.1 hypothetical protein [Pectobacterium carotovorum subsp. carotovorum]MCA6966644.1 hypothetical protein [Pectobacterium carotovorum]MCH4989069.1 hypothetical protein [Pectobacterium carotovorum]